MNTKFTVLMSLYFKESASNFQTALNSVLNQKLMPSEVVIVLDGPLTEELYEVIDLYKRDELIKIVPLKVNIGLGPALNEGLKHCSFDYIARMDTDDISVYDRFYDQINFFNHNPDYSIVGGHVGEFISDPLTIISQRKVPETYDEIMSYSRTRNPFNHPTVMYRRDTIRKLNGYENVPFFEDYDLWTRLLNSGFLGYNIQKDLVLMRTEADLFKRRGGLTYAKYIYDFRLKAYRNKYTTFVQFLHGFLPHAIVALLPNTLRESVYRKLLRD